MKKAAACVVVLLTVAFCLPPIYTQEREDRTLLNWSQMRAIINEASGERAMHAVLEMVPYPRVRERAEYEGHFRESSVLATLARASGYQGVEIESLPGGSPSWYASQAELWMVEPEVRKLSDIHDVAIAVCSGSESGDITAEVVDVGAGTRPENYAGKDVRGKIVLGSANAGVLQRLAVSERGAVGILSYASLRSESHPDQILSQSITSRGSQDKKLGFGWSILSGGLTLAFMILPTIIRTSEEAIKAVPLIYREVSKSLGAGKWQTIRRVVLPNAFPGILTGIILGVGRSVGETACVIFTAGSSLQMPTTLFSPIRSMAVHFYILAREGISMEKAFATAAVLIILILTINFFAYYFMHRFLARLR